MLHFRKSPMEKVVVSYHVFVGGTHGVQGLREEGRGKTGGGVPMCLFRWETAQLDRLPRVPAPRAAPNKASAEERAAGSPPYDS